jgi:hypothetical protein
MASKSRMRLTFEKHNRRYKESIAPATMLEGPKTLIQQRRYANRHAWSYD